MATAWLEDASAPTALKRSAALPQSLTYQLKAKLLGPALTREALKLDYIVTVAVQSAAGTLAVTSAVPALAHWNLEITVGVVLILFYGNLRGIREAGRLFAFPTYFFAGSMLVVILVGIFREITG